MWPWNSSLGLTSGKKKYYCCDLAKLISFSVSMPQLVLPRVARVRPIDVPATGGVLPGDYVVVSRGPSHPALDHAARL